LTVSGVVTLSLPVKSKGMVFLLFPSQRIVGSRWLHIWNRKISGLGLTTYLEAWWVESDYLFGTLKDFWKYRE